MIDQYFVFFYVLQKNNIQITLKHHTSMSIQSARKTAILTLTAWGATLPLPIVVRF